MHSRRQITLVVILLLALLLVSIVRALPESTVDDDVYGVKLLRELSLTRLREHIQYFASLPSRMVGYPGFYTASQYIYEEFKRYGLKTYYQNYTVVIPYVEKLKVTYEVPKREFGELRAYAVWPNLIQTCSVPPGSLKAKLVYVGSGSPEELAGVNVTGAVVLMDWNSKNNWVIVAKLGAKAVIFILPRTTTRQESMTKFAYTNLYFPRVVIPREEGLKLIKLLSKGDVYVSIESKVVWKEVVAHNIIGFLEGEDPNLKKEAMVYAAYYDYWSPVLGIANDEDSASGIASLLEIARLMAKYGTKRSVVFVALSGHWEALAGVRYFVEDYVEFKVDKTINYHPIWNVTTPKFFLSLDFSTFSDSIAILHSGGFYHMRGTALYQWAAETYEGFMVRFSEEWRGNISRLLEEIMGTKPRRVYFQMKLHHEGSFIDPQVSEYLTVIPHKYILDVEPWIRAGLPGFTLYTAEDYRLHWFVPLKGINKVNVDNLVTQTAFALSLMYLLANVEVKSPPVFPPTRIYGPTRLMSLGPFVGYEPGFTKARGVIVEYNITSIRQYEPIKERAIVYIVHPNDEYSVFNYIFLLTDENSTFVVYGLRPTTPLVYYPYVCRAFVIDFDTGRITYAPDFGRFGAERVKSTRELTIEGGTYGWPFPIRIVVFKCGSMTTFDILHPEGMRGGIAYIGYYSTVGGGLGMQVEVMDYSSKSSLHHFYYQRDVLNNILTIYVPPRVRFQVQIKAPSHAEVPETVILLLNSTPQAEEGHGYIVNSEGEELVLSMAPLQYALNLYYLSESRYRVASRFHVIDVESERALRESRQALSKVFEELNKGNVFKAYMLSYVTWSWALKSYKSTKSLIMGSITTTILMFVLLIPFSIIVERLVFESKRGKSRLVAMLLIYAMVLALLWVLHPGFHMVSSLPVLLLGFTIMSIVSLILSFVYGEFRSTLISIRRMLLGVHFEEVSRTDLASSALSIGIMNMKRRRSSTILTMITLILIIMSLTSLTSTVPVMVYVAREKPWRATYNGVMFRYLDFKPVSRELVTVLRALVGDEGVVAPRSWYYPLQLEAELGIYAYKGNRTAIIEALVGVTSHEELVTKISRGMVLGGNMWLGVWTLTERGWDLVPVLISETLAEDLGIENIGDRFRALGLEFIVVGIFNPKAFSGVVRDLDNETISPMELPEETHEVTQVSMPWDYVAIVPYHILMEIPGSYLVSVSVASDDSEVLERVSRYLAETTFNAYVLKGWNGEVKAYITIAGMMALGWSLLIPPLIIAALIILNTTISLVQSRMRDSRIFSSIGLSPLHVSLLFMAEIVAYAIVSCVVGYVAGIVLLNSLIAFGNLPINLYPNYASSFVALALGVAFLMVLLPSIYPAIMAGRSVTPMLERKWKIKTKPLGNVWSIPMPFRAVNVEEVLGVLYYIKEFLDAHRVERAHRWFAILREANVEELEVEGAKAYMLVTEAQLFPWEAGIIEKVELLAVPSRGVFVFELKMTLKSGVREQWIRSSPAFVDTLRKQLLFWRVLTPQDKRKYVELGRKLIGG